MFKKIAFAAPLAVLALSSSVVFAAGEARHSISLVAHVPTNGFYVVPTDSDLVNKDQDMSFSPITGAMKPVEGYFDVRNNNGSVHGSLEGVPKLVGGSSIIDLKVEFNGKVLTQTPQMVVGESESDVNYRAPLRITATGTDFTPGDYTGAVTMMFDAVPPVSGSTL
ncbi:CS1 type fimbrial major subunit [Pseudomonas sp. HS6]|uniref:CS1 type fimbrial major subunit n=1 Tax=Pseudomonas sp. HS6 TaxID=2850559 RepID=UPI002019BA9E|nr:CS1 type fimbrial major subunit [Pseudomonas sp. HS6]UQS17791.1 fimbrial assembly protein [Pseudomonas sp. HS6]